MKYIHTNWMLCHPNKKSHFCKIREIRAKFAFSIIWKLIWWLLKYKFVNISSITLVLLITLVVLITLEITLVVLVTFIVLIPLVAFSRFKITLMITLIFLAVLITLVVFVALNILNSQTIWKLSISCIETDIGYYWYISIKSFESILE